MKKKTILLTKLEAIASGDHALSCYCDYLLKYTEEGKKEREEFVEIFKNASDKLKSNENQDLQ